MCYTYSDMLAMWFVLAIDFTGVITGRNKNYLLNRKAKIGVGSGLKLKFRNAMLLSIITS